MEPKQQPPYPLRMPHEMRQSLEERATAEGRSLNAEILLRLQQSLSSGPVGAHRPAATEAEAAAERMRADSFKIAAEASDHIRTLLATILLSAIDRVSPQEARDDDDRLARSLIEWLGEKDQRGAVHSLLAIIDGADAQKVEFLRKFAAHLDELSAAEIPDIPRDPKKVIIVGNIGRSDHYDEDSPKGPAPKTYGPKRSANARKPKP